MEIDERDEASVFQCLYFMSSSKHVLNNFVLKFDGVIIRLLHFFFKYQNRSLIDEDMFFLFFFFNRIRRCKQSLCTIYFK